MTSRRDHWDRVYSTKGAEDVSWFRPHLDRSLAFVDAAALDLSAPVIDIGGGASTFVDDLLARGHSDLTVLDLSSAALEAARTRIGSRSSDVTWVCADVTSAPLPVDHFQFWHDRAVFHFLTDERDRRLYVDSVRRSVRRGGHIVIATFGPHGPEKCSNLDVVRFTPASLHAEFGSDFNKVADAIESHKTPWGTEQEFVYCYCRR
jgi:SAM-dependent methyltransferase